MVPRSRAGPRPHLLLATAGPPAWELPVSKGHLTSCLSKPCFLCSSATGSWCRRMEEEEELLAAVGEDQGEEGTPPPAQRPAPRWTRTRLSPDGRARCAPGAAPPSTCCCVPPLVCARSAGRID